LFASLRQLLATVVELAQVRLELLINEFEHEKLRLSRALLLAGVAFTVLGVGLVLLSLFIVMLVAEAHRLAVLGVLAMLFLGGGVYAMLTARATMQRPAVFESSVAELSQDRVGLADPN
jgi:uncharacterized membrane protein YqjE